MGVMSPEFRRTCFDFSKCPRPPEYPKPLPTRESEEGQLLATPRKVLVIVSKI
jgi:hypothetical protein